MFVFHWTDSDSILPIYESLSERSLDVEGGGPKRIIRLSDSGFIHARASKGRIHILSRWTHHHAENHGEAFAGEFIPVLALAIALGDLLGEGLLGADAPSLASLRPITGSSHRSRVVLLLVFNSRPTWVEIIDNRLVNAFTSLSWVQNLPIKTELATLNHRKTLTSQLIEVVGTIILAWFSLVARMGKSRISDRPRIIFNNQLL